MPWPKQCPMCRSARIETTKRTFQCMACKYFVDNTKKPSKLEFKTYRKKEPVPENSSKGKGE